MLTRNDGPSCLSLARRANQGEVCRGLTYAHAVFRLKAMAVQRARREREQ